MELDKDKNQNLVENKKEMVNHPKHYNNYPIEVIDMMESIWGIENTAMFCIMNAFKYRMRIGHKDDVEQDLKKERWYLNKHKELKEMLNNDVGNHTHLSNIMDF